MMLKSFGIALFVMFFILAVMPFVSSQEINPPTWIDPPNGFSVFNNSGWSVQWNATDDTAVDTYWINETDNFVMYTNGIMTNKTTVPGNYSVNITVNDTFNNNLSATITIEIKEYSTADITVPTWDQTPNSFWVFNNTGWSVEWNASDNIAIDIYFLNDTNNFFMSTTGTMTNKTNVPGNYSVNISVNDTSGNSNSTIINIEIRNFYVDNEPPTWVWEPYNLTYNESVPVAVDWNATDNLGIFEYFLDDTENFTINSSGFMRNNTYIDVGNYTVNLSVNDTMGNSNSTIINIEIRGTQVPPIITLSNPTNNSVIATGSNVNFSFSTSEIVTGNFTFDDNYTQDIGSGISFSYILNGTINSTDIAHGILAQEVHNIIIRVTDADSNTVNKEYRFTVTDNNPPLINAIDITNTNSGSATGNAIITVTTNEYAYCWISMNSSLDASSGISMTDYGTVAMAPSLGTTLTHSISFSADGTLPARYITCADALWNNMTTANTTGDIAVTVTESTGGNGGRGGGGLPLVPERNRTVVVSRGGAVISIPNVAAKSRSNSSILSIVGLDVSYLDFRAKRKLSDIQIKLSNFIIQQDLPPGKIYQSFKVDLINFTDDDINETEIKLSVNKKWMIDNNINKSTLKLYRKERQWIFYEMVQIGEDAVSIKFKALPSGFSLFAVTGEALTLGAKQDIIEGDVKSFVPNKVEELDKDSQIIDTKAPMDYTWWLVTLIIIGAAITLYTLRRRQVHKHSMFMDDGEVNIDEIIKHKRK